jgi:hypothetical protein
VGGWVGVWENSESKNYIPFGDIYIFSSISTFKKAKPACRFLLRILRRHRGIKNARRDKIVGTRSTLVGCSSATFSAQLIAVL